MKIILKLKKWIIIFAVILAASFAVNSYLTRPRPFNSIVKLDYRVRTITLVNGIHKAPVVKIEEKKYIDKLKQVLSESKYSIYYDNPLTPKGGGGPIFKLGLKGNSTDEQTVISCYGKLVTINHNNYIADPDVTWKIAAYLMVKNLDQAADLGLIKIAHDNINIISKKYGEQTPYIENIVPGLTQKFGGPKVKYDIHLRGNFKKGTLRAKDLYFSMQEIYPAFWDIKATNKNNETVWKD